MSESKDTQKMVSAQDPAPSALEWTVRGASFALVAGLFGFLLYGASQPVIGPNFVMDVDLLGIEERRNGWAVPTTITNRGTVAIGDVIFRIDAIDADGQRRVGKDGRIPIMGAGETVETEVWFDFDPRNAELELSIDTYTM